MGFLKKLGSRGSQPSLPRGMVANRFRRDPAFGDPEGRALIQRLSGGPWTDVPELLAGQADIRRRDLLVRVLGTAFSGRPGPIESWPRLQPDDGLGWLVRGYQGIDWAWEARGHARGSDTSREQFEAFFARLREAWDDLNKAAELLPNDAMPWVGLITVAMGLQTSQEVRWRIWDRVRERDPWHPEAHMSMARALCGKWSGSDEAMFEFVRTVTANAPEGDPVHGTIVTAHWEAALDSEGKNSEYFAKPEVREEIHAAAARSIDLRPGDRDPWLMRTRADFAFGYMMIQDQARMRAQLEVLDDCICGLWNRLGQPVEAFRAAREETGLSLA